MARTKKKPVFASPGWRQAIKCKFLSFAFQYNPHALELLATKAMDGAITAREWAAAFDLAGTWIEQWAEDTLQVWHEQPALCPMPKAPCSTAQVQVWYPPPRDLKTEADVFSFEISETPMCRLSLGITVGGTLLGDEPVEDWKRFKCQMHEQLELKLNEFYARALDSGVSDEIVVPDSLDKRLEIAALCLFCNISTPALAKHPAIMRSSQTEVAASAAVATA